MTNNIRRVHKEYVSIEKKIQREYKKKYGRNPSQTLVSQVIAKLINNKKLTFRLTKRIGTIKIK